MKVVILAAGVGSRLMPLTRNTPKSLIDLGNGYSLLELQLRSIGEGGIHDIVLITGYKSSQIEAKIQFYSDFSFRIIFNPFYRMTNNLATAWLGLKDLSPPLILVNGDDLFKADVIANLAKSTSEITMVISRKEDYDDDDMKVVTEGPLVRDVGKDIPPNKANGESIGMILFRGQGLKAYQERLSQMVRDEDNLHLFYLAALRPDDA